MSDSKLFLARGAEYFPYVILQIFPGACARTQTVAAAAAAPSAVIFVTRRISRMVVVTFILSTRTIGGGVRETFIHADLIREVEGDGRWRRAKEGHGRRSEMQERRARDGRVRLIRL